MSKKFLAVPFLFSLLFAFCFEAFAYSPAQNERLVVRSLRELAGAQATYNATAGGGSYGTFQNLGQAQLIDAVLATGQKYGYYFQMVTIAATATTPARYSVSARPNRYRKTGRKSFYIDESGVLRGADKNGAAATVADPEIEYECLPYEECAISNLRTLHSAEVTYNATIGGGNYGTFAQLHAAGLISPGLVDGSHHGYNFTYSITTATTATPASFKLWAVPINYGVTGRRSFFMGVDGVLRGADKNGAPADENDPPIE